MKIPNLATFKENAMKKKVFLSTFFAFMFICFSVSAQSNIDEAVKKQEGVKNNKYEEAYHKIWSSKEGKRKDVIYLKYGGTYVCDNVIEVNDHYVANWEGGGPWGRGFVAFDKDAVEQVKRSYNKYYYYACTVATLVNKDSELLAEESAEDPMREVGAFVEGSDLVFIETRSDGDIDIHKYISEDYKHYFYSITNDDLGDLMYIFTLPLSVNLEESKVLKDFLDFSTQGEISRLGIAPRMNRLIRETRVENFKHHSIETRIQSLNYDVKLLVLKNKFIEITVEPKSFINRKYKLLAKQYGSLPGATETVTGKILYASLKRSVQTENVGEYIIGSEVMLAPSASMSSRGSSLSLNDTGYEWKKATREEKSRISNQLAGEHGYSSAYWKKNLDNYYAPPDSTSSDDAIILPGEISDVAELILLGEEILR